MPLKIPKVIGHRGCAGYAPENTIEAIHTAADMGVKWVELDIKLTKDQVPVILHDETLDRTTNGHGKVAETTYSDLRELEAGSWFAESFSGAAIPTLEAVLDILLERGLGVNFEIKPCPMREKETAEVALDLISQIWDEPHNILISSFSHVSLEAAADFAGFYPRGLLLGKDWPKNWRDLARHLDVKTINIDGRIASKEQVHSVKEAAGTVTAYTINEAQSALQLQSWGVDGFFSDMPDILMDCLGT